MSSYINFVYILLNKKEYYFQVIYSLIIFYVFKNIFNLQVLSFEFNFFMISFLITVIEYFKYLKYLKETNEKNEE